MTFSLLKRRAVVAGWMTCAGCHSWQPTTATPEAVLVSGSADVRLVKTDGTILEVYDARLSGDTIRGHDGGSKATIAVASRDIVSMTVRQFSGDRTALAVVAGALAVAAGFVLLLLLVADSIAPSY